MKVSSDIAGCRLGSRDFQPRVLLMGDSHAASFEPFWDEIGKDRGLALVSATTNWCFPSASRDRMARQSGPAGEQCLENRAYLVAHGPEYETVILAAAWPEVMRQGFLDQALSVAGDLARRGAQVILMPAPKVYDTDVTRRARFALFNGAGFSPEKLPATKDARAREVNDKLAAFAAATPGVTFLSRDELTGGAESYADGGGELPVSFDGTHISAGASRSLAKAGPCARATTPCNRLISRIATQPDPSSQK